MDSVNWEVGPTKGVVEAFMETLVDPALPLSFSVDNPPSMDDRKSVARQMHGVVLLYNYCYRKQNPELEFLDFVSFCKSALTLRPCLDAFMKVTAESASTALNIDENQLSLTEKAVKDACDICVALDASKDFPVTEGLSIAKVVVLVIDSEKEKCWIQLGSVTEGAWSLFEKEIGEPSLDDEILPQENVGRKRSRTSIEKATDDKFVQLAYDAVKDATGIDRSDLAVLEVHDAFSFTKEKSAARFYMMQYRNKFDTDQTVRLKEIVEMFQGPWVEKYNDEWITLEVVLFYHMLPYVGFISSWLSRKDLCSPSFSGYNAKSTTKSGDKEISQSKTSAIPLLEYHKSSPSEGPSGNTVPDEDVSKKFKKRSSENSASDVNIPEIVIKRCVVADSVKEQRIIRPEVFNEDDGVNLQVVEKRLVLKSNDPPCRDEKNNANNGETTVKNALALLDIKRKELFSQLCNMGDRLASFEGCIQKIRDGGDVVLARHCINSIISGNDDLLLRNETQIEVCNRQSEKPTGSSDIFILGRSACQDLEYICVKNNWGMPRYNVAPSEGKFTSNVIVGSKDFELYSKGGLENSPCEARESAAAKLIAKIHATV